MLETSTETLTLSTVIALRSFAAIALHCWNCKRHTVSKFIYRLFILMVRYDKPQLITAHFNLIGTGMTSVDEIEFLDLGASDQT